jgi:hypothetical protein
MSMNVNAKKEQEQENGLEKTKGREGFERNGEEE